ncbi:hypothetical protein CTI14_59205 [Methylobacterium radiotolerans]|nr:hypothetical protein CTI14_59205 [Methylobacterium radiotolerans]
MLVDLMAGRMDFAITTGPVPYVRSGGQGAAGQAERMDPADPGSSQHLAAAQFIKLTGVDITHIPFKGSGRCWST